MLRRASSAVEKSLWSEKGRAQLQQLFYDVERLVLEFQSPACSALHFSPLSSELRRCFRILIAQDKPQVSRMPVLRPHWSARVLTIDTVASLPSGHPSVEDATSRQVIGVAISPNGTRVVSWEQSGRLHLWDILSGRLVASSRFQAPFTSHCSHGNTVRSEAAITFSSDNTSVLLISHLKIFLWKCSESVDNEDPLLMLSGEEGPALCCALARRNFRDLMVVGRARGISTWQWMWSRWVLSSSKPVSSCTTTVSISPSGQYVMTSECASTTVYLRSADDLAVVRIFPVGTNPLLDLLLCHMFIGDYALVLWSSRQDDGLVATYLEIPRTTLGPVLRRVASLRFKSELQGRPSKLKAVRLDNHLVALEVDKRFYSGNGTILTAWSPEKPLSVGSYARAAVISDEGYHIYIWDPSISAEDYGISWLPNSNPLVPASTSPLPFGPSTFRSGSVSADMTKRDTRGREAATPRVWFRGQNSQDETASQSAGRGT
ncbi:hypothetical protein CONPUDRAFT_77956 [Coniophora puteana RWD-64-598 SS2]|uniref:Uncharacterized protein n=1 Tax=Coniophora puteana (strain RWD-64-598) TaxID=741705 RepID=R7SEV2_CONPW|nr:uncharacterized protein CONPUDRAFT_77956 [Coniophora puteana RWD-64-598 SS2]EIW74688.1 hypothetical protein CONPUDRAFT_77956 [Coniophora puteana RWD-64-598 SS2]